MFNQRVMFDQRDLDPRYHDRQPLFQAIDASRRAGNLERNKAVRQVVANCIGKLRDIGRKYAGFAVNAAGQQRRT